jgi:hypothetical protein
LESDQLLWIHLPVSVAAVLYREDEYGIAKVMYLDAVITCADAEFRWFDVLEALDVALACGQIAGKNMQDVQRFSLIYGTKLRFGLIGPNELFVHIYLPDS